MKIETLFKLYKAFIDENSRSKDIFSASGMVNRYGELDFGFFPLGSGILNTQSIINIAKIEEGGTLVLGNDFGTTGYVDLKCSNKRENGNKTIVNLKTIGLNVENTFFTNLFMGLRDEKSFPGTTMTKLICIREQEYIDLCFSFFKIQLEFIKPQTIVCLGAEVGKNLAKYAPVFSSFSQKNLPLTKMFEEGNERKYIIKTNDELFGKRKFVLIPHPSYAHINWGKNDIKNQIEIAITT